MKRPWRLTTYHEYLEYLTQAPSRVQQGAAALSLIAQNSIFLKHFTQLSRGERDRIGMHLKHVAVASRTEKIQFLEKLFPQPEDAPPSGGFTPAEAGRDDFFSGLEDLLALNNDPEYLCSSLKQLRAAYGEKFWDYWPMLVDLGKKAGSHSGNFYANSLVPLCAYIHTRDDLSRMGEALAARYNTLPEDKKNNEWFLSQINQNVPSGIHGQNVPNLISLNPARRKLLIKALHPLAPGNTAEKLLGLLPFLGLGKEGQTLAGNPELVDQLFSTNQLDLSWDHLEHILVMGALFPKAAYRLLPHLIITMHMFREGVTEAVVSKENIKTLGPRIRQEVIDALEAEPDLLLQRQMVKVLALGDDDQIYAMRQQAILLVEAFYGRDSFEGLVGNIRRDIHTRPTPRDLKAARAYLEFAKNGNSETLSNLGFQLTDQDAMPADAEKKAEVIKAAEKLVVMLEDIYGEGSLAALTEHYLRWRETPGGHPDLEAEISRVLVLPNETTVGDLNRLAAVRVKLSRLSRSLQGEARLRTLVLDNHLEQLFYAGFNSLRDNLDFSKPSSVLDLISTLLVNTQANGYDDAEIQTLLGELKALSLQKSTTREYWLKIYSLFKRSERLLAAASQHGIETYQDLADHLGTNANEKEKAWLDKFSANLFRSDTIYLLSQSLSEAKKAAAAHAQISGWDIMVPGEAEGVLRFIEKPEELKNVLENEIIVIRRLPPDVNLAEVRGIVVLEEDGLLSHPAIQARKLRIPLVVCPDWAILEKYKNGEWIQLTARGEDDVVLEKIDGPKRSQGPPVKAAAPISLPPADTSRRESVVLPERYTQGTVGNKAFRLGRLNAILEKIKAGVFKPRHFTINFSLYQKVLANHENEAIKARLEEMILQASAASKAENLPAILKEIRDLLAGLKIPEDELNLIRQTINKSFGKHARVFLRSSTNAEDLPGFPAAGQYDSFGNIEPTNAELAKNIKKVWASTWNDRAFHDRKTHRIRHTDVVMAVLVQETVPADYAFVVHTENPSNPDEVLVEVVQGLGESLVSGAPEFAGSPYRFAYHKKTGEVRIVRFANKSQKIIIENGVMKTVRASYADDPLTTDQGLRFIRTMAETSLKIERGFGSPQDIEGAVKLEGSTWRPAYLQSRDQIEVIKPGGPPVSTAGKYTTKKNGPKVFDRRRMGGDKVRLFSIEAIKGFLLSFAGRFSREQNTVIREVTTEIVDWWSTEATPEAREGLVNRYIGKIQPLTLSNVFKNILAGRLSVRNIMAFSAPLMLGAGGLTWLLLISFSQFFGFLGLAVLTFSPFAYYRGYFRACQLPDLILIPPAQPEISMRGAVAHELIHLFASEELGLPDLPYATAMGEVIDNAALELSQGEYCGGDFSAYAYGRGLAEDDITEQERLRLAADFVRGKFKNLQADNSRLPQAWPAAPIRRFSFWEGPMEPKWTYSLGAVLGGIAQGHGKKTGDMKAAWRYLRDMMKAEQADTITRKNPPQEVFYSLSPEFMAEENRENPSRALSGTEEKTRKRLVPVKIASGHLQLEVLSHLSSHPGARPPLILIHGICHGAWCWENYLDFFSKQGFDVYALSLRGHGASAGGDRI
ncbi:MAG: hypothetical protein HGA76_07495, partial [Candidatus Firestonebacteria bacterium]|nr:hypothetical protein [Candidatus Firestonebacteria bacterium]